MIEEYLPSFDTLSMRIERGDIHRYVTVTEASNPEDALLARQVHAKSYLGEGFILDDAIDETGQVVPDIDKARGDNVAYYLGFSKEGEPVSTLRKVTAERTGGFQNLPGYQLCEANLSESGKIALTAAELQGRPITEISSFGHVPESSAHAGLELLRHVLQESLGTDELWFFTMVTQKYQTLVKLFGPRVVQKIGDEVVFNDSRIGDVSLTPAMVDTTSFFDDIKEGILHEPQHRERQRLLSSLRNFARGVDRKRLSEEVRMLLDDESDFNFIAYVKESGVRQQPVAWSQPVQLDGGNRLDALYAKRLIDEGKVRAVVDPRWHDISPTIPNRNGDTHNEGGPWFYYPWRESLMHFPGKATYRELRQKRDRHLVTADEQAQLYEKNALFAGLSVGSHVLEHMTYAGIGSSYTLADFDTVSVSNLNRIHAGMAQVGERKTDVFAKQVSELDPYVKLKLLHQGITEESLSDLADAPDIIFDAVDDFATKALLRMYAKEHRIPLIMATDVGYKSVIDIERHDIRDTELFNGRLNHEMIEAMLSGELTKEQRMKIMTKLIGLSNASFRLLESVSDGSLEGFPQLEVTASQGGALATIAARDILLGRSVPSGRSVHDARKSMHLSAEVPLREGIVILKKFIAKS